MVDSMSKPANFSVKTIKKPPCSVGSAWNKNVAYVCSQYMEYEGSSSFDLWAAQRFSVLCRSQSLAVDDAMRPSQFVQSYFSSAIVLITCSRRGNLEDCRWVGFCERTWYSFAVLKSMAHVEPWVSLTCYCSDHTWWSWKSSKNKYYSIVLGLSRFHKKFPLQILDRTKKYSTFSTKVIEWQCSWVAEIYWFWTLIQHVVPIIGVQYPGLLAALNITSGLVCARNPSSCWNVANIGHHRRLAKAFQTDLPAPAQTRAHKVTCGEFLRTSRRLCHCFEQSLLETGSFADYQGLDLCTGRSR